MKKLIYIVPIYSALILFSSCGLNKKHRPVHVTKNKNLKEFQKKSVEDFSNQYEQEQLNGTDHFEGLSLEKQNDNEKVIGNSTKEKENEESSQNENDRILGLELDVKDNAVDKWIKYFSQKDSKRFQRMLNRGAKYKQVVEDILEENGLPRELFYLALIESGFVTHAKSRASAVGAWQFMKGTAKAYGLEVNSSLDERRDPIRATEAAAKYLRRLYNAFQSWELALAAYNSGEYRVLGALMRGGTRDFSTLVEKRLLPRETRNYVPKLKASILIGENPKDYGFVSPKVHNAPVLELVKVPGGVSFKTIQKYTGVSQADLKKYNSHLVKRRTPSQYKNYEIWVTKRHQKKVASARGTLQKYRKKYLKKYKRYAGGVYKVRRGDNLFKVAKRFNSSIRHLKQINNLRGDTIYPGQKLRISTRRYRPLKRVTYKVRRGDNLSGIARQYGLSLSELKRINGLRGNRIYIGQRLNVSASKAKTYKVRRGDNLSLIAKRFGVPVKRLKRLNRMRRDRILVGQLIKIHP